MKLEGKFVLKVAGTLTAISLVVALLLGLVNGITAEKISALNKQKTDVALSEVVPTANARFEEVEVSEDMAAAVAAYSATLDSLYEVYDESDMIGYAVKVVASGSQGSIEMVVGVDNDKAVTGVSVVKHSETSGIGTKVCNNDTGMLDNFIGMSHAGGDITVNKGTNKIDGVSGATVSSKGVTKGVNGAIALAELLG